MHHKLQQSFQRQRLVGHLGLLIHVLHCIDPPQHSQQHRQLVLEVTQLLVQGHCHLMLTKLEQHMSTLTMDPRGK